MGGSGTGPWRRVLALAASCAVAAAAPSAAAARPAAAVERAAGADPRLACDYGHLPSVVWWGAQRELPLSRLAAYLAPVLWFSPDEPLLAGTEGTAIRIPEALPFEASADRPVLYYQLEQVVGEAGAWVPRDDAPGRGVVDLARTRAFSLNFLAYFPSEEGLGSHPHDIEPVLFKAAVLRTDSEVAERELGVRCDAPGYLVVVTRVTAQAHGLVWFFNVLEVDEETRFPMHVLVEEGKHALCTDKNGDGYYTPGYDTNERINDAWGVRDVIRSGALFSGSYQGYMTKVRRPRHQVLPPLPEDSPLTIGDPEEHGLDLAVYELRPYPPSARAADDPHLLFLMRWREVEGWPVLVEVGSAREVVGWLDAGRAIRSVSVALMFDGRLGAAFAFPLLLVRNVEDPIGGGFIVHRVYLTRGKVGWMALYTPSASRWFDTYLAAGVEWLRPTEGAALEPDFVLETGLRLRVNLAATPLRFLGVLTDFWGLRLGVRNRGAFRIDRMTYVLELGAGVW